MGKRKISDAAICPFYKSEDPQKIYCEGPEDGSSIHVAFGSSIQKSGYEQYYCCQNWKDCLVASALEAYWE